MPNLTLRRKCRRWLLPMLGWAVVNAPLFGAETDDPGGAISGRVIATDSGAPVAGAVVQVEGSALQVTSDLNGAYFIDHVPAGAHSLFVVRAPFRSTTLTDLNVVAGRTTHTDVPMEGGVALADEIVTLEDFTISASAAEGSNLALLSDRQKAPVLSDAIGEDMITRLGVGDAAEAMSKVTGASVVDGKYVFVRGLGDRYSNTLLNGMTVPSADPDRRAVQMDQFPASVLESIVTSKSFTPDQPGGFSGGSVNLRTKSFPDHFFVSVGTEVGFNSAATGKDGLTVPGGGSDWLGRDDGTRGLPAGLPDSIPTSTAARNALRFQNDSGPARELDRISNSFHNDTYFPRSETAGPNYGFSFATGDRLNLGGERELGYIFSLTYNRATTNYTGGYAGRYSQGSLNPDSSLFVNPVLVYSANLDDFNYATQYAATPDIPGGPPSFGVTQTSRNVDWGAYAQVAFKPSLNHEATFRYLHTQSAQDAVKRGVGESTRSDAGRMYQEYDMSYTERAVDSLQLAGQSLFPDAHDVKVEWRASTSKSTQDQPDYRTLSNFWDFANQQYATAAGVGNNRVFRNIEETNNEVGADVTVPLSLRDRPVTVKLGGDWQDGSRTYRERRFRWSREANQIDILENYPNPVGIISITDTDVTFGNTISELSNRLLNYDGDQSIRAGYLMADIAVADQWRVITGVRAEQTQISTGPISDDVDFEATDIHQTDYLPALSVVYAMRPDMNVRAAYGRTIARPLYRELAGIRVDDFFRDTYFQGQPLELSHIDNLDLRWEWFPGANEILAAGVFYKDFNKPIEILFDARRGAEQPRNLDSGRLYGVEFEARFGLQHLHHWFEEFSLGGNLSLMQSREDIPADELATTRAVFPDASATRELFGQSPYVLNVDLSYSHPASGTAVTVAYNQAGKRLALVTSDALPEIYEYPPAQLDLLISQRLWRGWRVKLAARNLLGSPFEKSFRYAGRTYYYERYQRGRTFTLSLSYLFE